METLKVDDQTDDEESLDQSLQELFFRAFGQYDLTPNESIDEKTFRGIIKNDNSMYDENVLLQIYTDMLSERGIEPVISELIDELVYILLALDNKIAKLLKYKQKCEDSIHNLNFVLKELRRKEYDLNIPTKDRNTVKIRYIKDRSNELLQKFKIKYRIGTNEENLTYVRNTNKPSICTLPLAVHTADLTIEVSKGIRNYSYGEIPYTIITKTKLPMNEVYTSCDPTYYLRDVIPSIYLFIPYTDEEKEKEKEKVADISSQEVEVEFHLNLDFEFREKKLTEFIHMWKSNYQKVNKHIEDTLRNIHEIIYPFNEIVGYAPLKHYYDNSRRKNSMCQSCHLI